MKKILRMAGFSLFEAIFVVGFMAVLFALLYQSLNVSMRTHSMIFNNDDAVKKNAYAFAEILARSLRQTMPSLVTVFPIASDSQTSSGQGTTADFDGTRAVSFIFSGRAPYFTPANQNFFKDFFETVSFFEDDDLPLSQTVSNDIFAVYYYDREGEVFGEKNAFYEILASIDTEDRFFKRRSSTVRDYVLLERSVKEFAVSAKSGRGYRKIASNMVFFNVSLDAYPIIKVGSSFYYGKGGTSSRVSSQDSLSNESEVFDLDFQILPGM